MNDKQKTVIVSVLVLSAALCGLAALTTCMLYRNTIQLETQRLTELVHSHAVLIEEFSHLAANSQGDTVEDALIRIRKSHLEKECFGRTGELVMAKLEKGQIVFLSKERNRPKSLPLLSEEEQRAAPIRQALSGKTGTMIGLDYQGITVLAAFQPVAKMNLGLVAKIDLAEVRRPFFQAAATAGGAVVLIVLAGIVVLLRFNPFLRRLEKEKLRAQNYLDMAGTMIVVLDNNGRIQLVNRKGCEILGGAQEGLAGLFWVDHCIHPDEQEAATTLLNQLLAGQVLQIDSKEFRLRRVSGEERLIEWSGRVLRNSKSQVTGVLAAAVDITERKKIERTLQEAKQDFQATFEQAAVGIGHVAPAPSGRWLRVNRKLCSILGYTPEELLRMNIRDVTHPAYLEQSYAKAVKLVSNPELTTYSMEKQYLRQNGSSVWVNHTVSLVRDEQGQPKYYISVIEDIQMRKEMEEVLRERTELLLRSNKELDDFAYIASHDLKEPLRGIMSYSTFLLEDYGSQLDAEGRDKLKTMGDLAGRLSTLTDDLLTFSRVGRLELARRSVNLNRLVEDVLATLKVSLERENVSIRIPDPLPTVVCDAVRMREVYYNLISNALKYNDKKEKWIELGVLRRWNDSAQTVFYVCDNGIGIRDKHADKVFTMFKRLHSGNKFGGGTGAGLAIVKKIIERHDGHIWLESAEGEGTIFFFTLIERQDSPVWLESVPFGGIRNEH
ncbi:MAG: PAS domain S-box-containing protein [Candidatus Electronema aureum]|uniref:histidine kinase n=1 Tax=Candidatus Electronema aureum TaxID=2005002 RepID=A0A521FZF5_9BACT|nr:MAG: PAS domain S-box-containing protein [Candidatus Electronema aureum]